MRMRKIGDVPVGQPVALKFAPGPTPAGVFGGWTVGTVVDLGHRRTVLCYDGDGVSNWCEDEFCGWLPLAATGGE